MRLKKSKNGKFLSTKMCIKFKWILKPCLYLRFFTRFWVCEIFKLKMYLFLHNTKKSQWAKKNRTCNRDLKLYIFPCRPGKSVWDKKWVVLGNNHVYIYGSDRACVQEESDPVEEFDLRPCNGFVTIHSAVTAAELTNTASTDLPYILRLEFEPETTCWPGR